MNLANVRRVLFKELRETLRDRRTLLIMIGVPILLYPALLIALEQLAIFGRRALEAEPSTVVVQGGGEDVLFYLSGDSVLQVERTGSVSLEALRAGEVDVVVALEPAGPEAPGSEVGRVLYDASRDRSRRAQEVVTARLQEWNDSLLAYRLAEQGLPRSFASPLVVADSSVATAQRMGGYALGRFLPMILVLMTLLGAFYPAIDLTAGEKERGTLEPLLTSPVPAREIVAGKFLAVTILAVSAGALNLGSMLLTFESGVFRIVREAGIQLSLPLTTVALVLLFLVPLAVLFSALFLGLAVRAQSFKEAQNTLTPVQLVSLIPTYLPLIPGIPFSYGVALIPVGGVAVLFRELMTGSAPVGPSLVALGATILYALLALVFAARAFGREEVLFGSGAATASTGTLLERLADWRRTRSEAPSASVALGFVVVVALLYFYVGVRLQFAYREQGLLASQWLLLALPAVLFAVLGPYRARSTLLLRPARPRALGAAALIVMGGIPVGWGIAWLQGLVLEVPEEFLSAFEQLLSSDSPGRLLWLLLVVAITPAICEELVFRGVLLQGLSREMSMVRAVLVAAVIFGAFHLSFETVIRFLPTAWLGALFGFVAWHTRSLLPSMLMHFINNAAVLLLVAYAPLRTLVTSPDGDPRWLVMAAGLVPLALGLRLLPKREPWVRVDDQQLPSTPPEPITVVPN